jgi:V-type H+-transporting ATPase subunit H
LLTQVLKSAGTAAEPLAVAAHDIGEYVRLYPRGKKMLDTLGTKNAIMTLMMEHSDQNVRYEALVAVQKLMTNNWCDL